MFRSASFQNAAGKLTQCFKEACGILQRSIQRRFQNDSEKLFERLREAFKIPQRSFKEAYTTPGEASKMLQGSLQNASLNHASKKLSQLVKM